MLVAHHGSPNGSPNPPPPPHSTPPPPATSTGHPDTDPQQLLQLQLRIDINRPATDTSSFPLRALLLNLLKELHLVNATNALLPINPDSTLPFLHQANDFPADDTIDQYFGGFQDAPGRQSKETKTLRVFVRIQSDRSLRDLKANSAFYNWLKHTNIFLSTHGFSKSFTVASAGFIAMMHPNLHRRDQVDSLIQSALKETDIDFEVHLVPNRIPIGKGHDKTHTNIVEIRVDRQHIHKTREILIDIFETYADNMPKEFYFVPTPANGSMTFDTYYQHLHLHQNHIAQLRSFAITNVRMISADITVYDSDGSNPRIMAFERALLSQQSPTTKQALFSSVEPTQTSHTDGRYLILTTKDLLTEAETSIDAALQSLNAHTANHANVRRTSALITRTNRIESSPRFQSYTAKLRGMIPATIHTAQPTDNAWKRRTPTLVNLSEQDFPPLHASQKKQRPNATTHANDTSTTQTDTTTSLTDIDIEAIEMKQQAVTDALTQQIDAIRQETAQMQRTLQEHLQTSIAAMSTLETRLEHRIQSAISSLSDSVHSAVSSMQAQSTRYDARLSQFLAAFQDQADRMTTQVDRMFQTQPPDPHAHNDHMQTTPPRSPDHHINRPRVHPPLHDDRPFIPTVWDMEHTDQPADGSPKSYTSQASPPPTGPDASTTDHK